MRYSRRRNNVAIAALMLCLAFAAGMIVFALRQMPGIGTAQAREAADNAAPAEQRYAGTIVIPGRGACAAWSSTTPRGCFAQPHPDPAILAGRR
jgi:hypothetical protein